jgi:hypothetical protein
MKLLDINRLTKCSRESDFMTREIVKKSVVLGILVLCFGA